ncbi:MAG: AAA family ATPase, partial [Bacillota bacterium]
GVGFKTADKIAQNMGIERSSRRRLRAGLQYMLIWARQEGHTYLPREALLQGAAEMLECDPDLLDETLDTLIIDGTLQYSMAGETDAVYLPVLHHMEKDCARRLLLLARAPEDEASMDLDRELFALERELKIELAQEQRAAVLSALREGAMVITGGPGTGKTTILQFILRIMTRLGLDYALCAPTGRAAKRMTEATGFEAATIHRLLEYGGEGQSRFSRNEDNPLFYDMVVVDEMSMVDLPLMYALLRALPQGTRLIMVGDADQLPPVGAGTVLHDIIESGVLPVTRLTEIFRQSDRSGIAKNAQRINAGQPPQPEPDSDFTFSNCPVTELALEKVVSLCSGGDPTLFTCDPQCGVQVLSPTKKGPLGVKNLNVRLQAALNPPAPHKAEREFGESIFREGDKVMQIKNDYRMEWMRTGKNGVPEMGLGVYNGDLGTIYRMDMAEQTLDVLFDDERMASYTFSQLDELELAYCISIHKSQGSEFPIVILPLFSGPPILMTRNLLYTAVTRARRQVLIVGRWDSVMQMVENKRMRRRYSAMGIRMAELAPLLLQEQDI